MFTPRIQWLVALAIGGGMIAAGIALHPALIVGGGLVATFGLVGWLQTHWPENS